MSLKLGTNSFLIKKYSALTLGIISANELDFEVEYHQKYFHIVYIPFFPLDKIWCIRKGRDLSELPAHYTQILVQKKITAPTPWYTFAGSIILTFFLILFGITNAVNLKKRSVESKQYFYGKNDSYKNLIKGLNNRDFIKLNNVNTEKKSIDYLKVQKVEGEKIYVSILQYNLNDYWNAKDKNIDEFYSLKKDSLDTLIVNRTDLLKAGLIESEHSPEEKNVNLMLNKVSYFAEEIVRHNGVIIKEKSTGSYGRNEIGLDFFSEGWRFDIIAISNITNSIQWLNKLPFRIDKNSLSYDNAFYLTGKNYNEGTPYKFKITTKDTTGTIHNYLVEGYNCTNNVIPMD